MVLITYAWILYLKREYTQARIYIEEALRYTPEDAESATTFDHAGDIYFRLNNRSQALTYWKKALSLTRDRSLKQKLQRKVWRKRL